MHWLEVWPGRYVSTHQRPISTFQTVHSVQLTSRHRYTLSISKHQRTRQLASWIRTRRLVRQNGGDSVPKHFKSFCLLLSTNPKPQFTKWHDFHTPLSTAFTLDGMGVDVPVVEFTYTLYLHACHVRVTVGDSGLCCCTCVTYFER